MRKLLLKITAIATGCAMVCGTVLLVNAKSNKEVINTEVETLADPLEKPVLLEEVHWYELNETNSSTPSAQTFKSPTPMPGNPPTSGNTECAQSGNAGDFCGVALKFTGDPLNPIDTDLTGYSDLQDVLDNHPNAVIIASGDISVDADLDGYSRQPL